jgi:hypothetical protein
MAEPGQIGNVELGNFPFPALFPRSLRGVQYRCQFQGRCLPTIPACAHFDGSSWWSRYSPQLPSRLRPGAGLERACPWVGTGVPMGGYDGYWNVLIITQVGACDRTYRFPVTISRGRVLGGGGPRVSGRVGRGGAVAVSVSAGNSYASGSGRLGTTSGGGRWSGRGSLGVCAGRWQATRSSF